MAVTRSTEPLVWIDCEMTGLDPDTESILQIACYITDHNLNLVDADGWHAVIRHSSARMAAMDEWCTRTHGSSGLTVAVLKSTTTAEMAATALLEYLKTHVPEPGKALLAGNSVHADRAFLSRGTYARVLRHLHYRIFDVSSLKEAVRRWAPVETLQRVPTKQGLHQAKEDILESIEEARFYRDTFFQK